MWSTSGGSYVLRSPAAAAFASAFMPSSASFLMYCSCPESVDWVT